MERAAIHVSDDIEVTVLAVTGNQVRIEIDVPQEILVQQMGVYQKIRRNWNPA